MPHLTALQANSFAFVYHLVASWGTQERNCFFVFPFLISAIVKICLPCSFYVNIFLLYPRKKKYSGEVSSECTWNQASAYNTSAVDSFHQMTCTTFQKVFPGTSLRAQWPTLGVPSAGGLELDFRYCNQISCMLLLKILCIATKARCSQVNIYKKFSPLLSEEHFLIVVCNIIKIIFTMTFLKIMYFLENLICCCIFEFIWHLPPNYSSWY